MAISSYVRVLKLGAINFYRNYWLSLASILVLTLALLIISFFLILNFVIVNTAQGIKEKIDLEVYFKDELVEEDILSLKTALSSRDNVASVEYVSKDKALEIWQSRQKGEIRGFISELENPLPRSLKIKASSAEEIKNISVFLQNSQFKKDIRKISSEENQPIIDKIISISSFSKKVGVAASLIFAVIALVVIVITVQMSIYIRKEEIGIMRLVGANNFYIRIPFIVESIFYGIGATLMATILLKLGLKFLMQMITDYFGDTSLDLREFFYDHLGQILLWQLLFSIFIAATAALISMRRYLRI